MENSIKHKILGVVTLWFPDIEKTLANIRTYINDIDSLIIYDNTPLDEDVKGKFSNFLKEYDTHVFWYGVGKNKYIASAINYAWNKMRQQSYQFLLIMDQDSSWENFHSFKNRAIGLFEHDIAIGAIFPSVPTVYKVDHKKAIEQRRFFINSGTLISLNTLNVINGADETFPLDALDKDLSIRIQKAGLKLFCLNDYKLTHHLGQPKRLKYLPIGTNDYGVDRTYSITKGNIQLLKKHHQWLTCHEKWKEIKETILFKPLTIILIENEKIARLKAFYKGIIDGITI